MIQRKPQLNQKDYEKDFLLTKYKLPVTVLMSCTMIKSIHHYSMCAHIIVIVWT